MAERKFDFLVIGSGIAGMSYALKVAKKGTVALICKSELEEANTYFAQGGIASVTNNLVDNFEKHIEDTKQKPKDEKAESISDLEDFFNK